MVRHSNGGYEVGGRISENKCRNLLIHKDLGRCFIIPLESAESTPKLELFFDVSPLIVRVYGDRRARRRKSLCANGLRRMAYPTE
jgi:hypothetical protein